MAVLDPRIPTAACGRAHGFISYRTAASNGLSALIELCRDQNGPRVVVAPLPGYTRRRW